jgi:hypothetical protein
MILIVYEVHYELYEKITGEIDFSALIRLYEWKVAIRFTAGK